MFKNNNNNKRSIITFEGQSTRSKNWFALEENWLKIISRQEKIIFSQAVSELYSW